MAVAGTLVQSTGGCPQGCGGPAIGTPTCASRTGSGNLCGISKFANPNTGDWNLRKYTRSDTTGQMSVCAADGPESCPDIVDWNTSGIRLDSCSKVFDVSDCSSDSTTEAVKFLGSGDCGANTEEEPCSSACGEPNPAGCHGFGLGSTDFNAATSSSATETTRSTSGDDGCAFYNSGTTDPIGEYKAIGTITTTLSLPDSVTAALVRGSSTSGALCKTTAGTIGSTSAGATGTLAITGTTSVQVTIPLTGLTVALAYTITADINRYTAGGGAFVDTVQVEIDFTADGASDTVDYGVPVNTDFDYEFASIVSVLPA